MLLPELEDCIRCCARAGLENLEVSGERRWRVRCPLCNRMTMHHGAVGSALDEWAIIQEEQRGKK